MIGIEIEEQRSAARRGYRRPDAPAAQRRAAHHRHARYRLRNARSQYSPYSDFEIGVAAIASPTGPRIAGKHGIGLLSIGATAQGGFDALAHHWDVMEARAQEFDTVADRNKWRLVGPMHIAETQEQAIEDVRYGLDVWAYYTQKILAVPHFRAAGETFEERVDWVNETGLGVIGTPDQAIDQIDRLMKQSNGGFGCYLLMHTSGPGPRRSSGATSSSPNTSNRASRARHAGSSWPSKRRSVSGRPSATASNAPCRPRPTGTSAPPRSDWADEIPRRTQGGEMRAAVYYGNSKLSVEDVPEPDVTDCPSR